MASLLQHLLSPPDPRSQGLAQAVQAGIEDDIPLGCECADPSLQFEGWDPLALSPSPSGTAPAC